jgi:di/tricarboxylate transporter
MEIRVGDVLLLHGGEDAIADAIANMECYPLAKRDLAFSKSKKAIPALLSFFIAITAAAAGVVPIQLALGIVTIVMAVLNIVPVREFYDAVDWPIVILLGAMIPLGAALETTGTTMMLVDVILKITGNLSPLFVLVILLTVTMTVSDVLNNAATAILMAPIAYNIALALNVNPDTFLMAIAIGASCAFLTPIGHQNNALIMGPGGYKFSDYWRMGLPLEIIIITVAVPALLFFWPL